MEAREEAALGETNFGDRIGAGSVYKLLGEEGRL